MIITNYRSSRDIDVYFPDSGHTTINRGYSEFKKGVLKDLYAPTFLGIGYLGEGKYKSGDNRKRHLTWCHILERCYNPKTQQKHPSYIGCTVTEEWHNFQNFAKWFDDNYYEIPNEIMCLDKDILIKGNKIYSPDTCVFVPNDINVLFTKTNRKRGDYPIGVSYHKKLNKYQANCNKDGELIYLGVHNTPLEAFSVYKKYKENLIKIVADKYKNYIPFKLYEALYDYKVEIDD